MIPYLCKEGRHIENSSKVKIADVIRACVHFLPHFCSLLSCVPLGETETFLFLPLCLVYGKHLQSLEGKRRDSVLIHASPMLQLLLLQFKAPTRALTPCSGVRSLVFLGSGNTISPTAVPPIANPLLLCFQLSQASVSSSFIKVPPSN